MRIHRAARAGTGLDRGEFGGMRLPSKALVFALAIAAIVSAGPARAGQVGSIVAPTFGSAGPPRMMFASGGVNGVTGYVFEHGAAGRPFTLRALDRPSGLEDFDISFYASLDSTEPVAWFAEDGDEAGTVPAGARWAIVTMSAGANGTFLFTA